MKLKDQIHQTTQTTKSGTLDIFPPEQTGTIEDKFHDNLQTFEAKIARAKGVNQEWVETSKEMIDYIATEGGWKDYIWYKNVKVCEFGNTDKAQALINEPLYQKQFNNEEGIIETSSQ